MCSIPLLNKSSFTHIYTWQETPHYNATSRQLSFSSYYSSYPHVSRFVLLHYNGSIFSILPLSTSCSSDGSLPWRIAKLTHEQRSSESSAIMINQQLESGGLLLDAIHSQRWSWCCCDHGGALHIAAMSIFQSWTAIWCGLGTLEVDIQIVAAC